MLRMNHRVVIVHAYGSGGSTASRLTSRLRDYERVEVPIEEANAAVTKQTVGIIFTGASGAEERKSTSRRTSSSVRSRRGGIDAAIQMRRDHPAIPVGVYAAGVSSGDVDDAAKAGVTIEVRLDVLLARLGLVPEPAPVPERGR